MRVHMRHNSTMCPREHIYMNSVADKVFVCVWGDAINAHMVHALKTTGSGRNAVYSTPSLPSGHIAMQIPI